MARRASSCGDLCCTLQTAPFCNQYDCLFSIPLVLLPLLLSSAHYLSSIFCNVNVTYDLIKHVNPTDNHQPLPTPTTQPPEDEVDKQGVPIMLYEAAFHPDVMERVGKDQWYKDQIIDLGLGCVEERSAQMKSKKKLKLDREKMKVKVKPFIKKTMKEKLQEAAMKASDAEKAPFDLKMPGMPGMQAAAPGGGGGAGPAIGEDSNGSVMDQLGSILGGPKKGGGGGGGGVSAGVGEKGPTITIPGLGTTRAGADDDDDDRDGNTDDNAAAASGGIGITLPGSAAASAATRSVVIEELGTTGGGEVDEVSGVATPEYTVVTKEEDGEVVVTVQLPKVGGVGEIELDVTKESFALNVPDLYKLEFKLPQAVQHDASKAKFKKKSHKLILRIPLL